MRTAVLAALLVLVAAPGVAQPDVVLIVADDLGFGDVGYNGSDIQTPHLDQLAAEGLVLDRFYVSPLCSPSRAGLLTGRYGVRMGINEPVSHSDTLGLPPAEVTLAEYLDDAGYETAMVGKWHLGDDCPFHPLQQGFDSFVGLLSGGASYFDRRNVVGLDWWRDAAPVDTGGYTTDLIAAEAVEVLSRPRDGPLFLYLPFTAPHTPLHALEEDLVLYPGVAEPHRTFAAMTTALDRAVGRVMASVRASGRPTLVWFLSDNGAVEDFGGSNGGLRGGKGQHWEGAIRVPSVVWYPEWGAGEVSHPVWYLDVLPTVLGLLPQPPTPVNPLDGTDQGAFLAGAPPDASVLERTLFSYRRTGTDGYWLAAQSALWKYAEHRTPDRTAVDLFRIDLDPYEQADSSRSYRGQVAAMRQAAIAFTELTLPGAAHDETLTIDRPPDLAECSGILTTPPGPPPGGLSLRVGPNPLRDDSAVRIETDRYREVRVDLFDLLGRRVRTLFTGTVEAGGRRAVPLRPGGLPSGVYIVRVTASGASMSARVVVAR
ncbi:sulfatase-like hydrolase/transferase [Rubrivirga marina]|uniref:Sulfatase N-terminal domain-containing protein n=1 Tax=Rubrivirga marina TaxID=1196024 RepID=A0A271J0Q3_9BACT|nr:sulfatase-like hydrolase/transferase [Rubrivirga marina]PAP76309.1 hypothetical protein BSZ37_07550 [Rubrivirga marina]